MDNVMLFYLSQFGYSPPEDLFGLEAELKPRSQFYIFICFISLGFNYSVTVSH